MTASVSMPQEVITYLGEVRAALADLPPEEREELLADVEISLLDAAGEGEPLIVRLGTPREFASELRAAAGLAPSVPPSAAAAAEPSLLTKLRALAEDPRIASARRTGRELAPIWWVVRGYVAVAALALFGDGSTWYERLHLIPNFFPALLMAGIIAAVIAASVALGLRTRRNGPSRWLTPLNTVLAIATLPVLVHVATWGSEPVLHTSSPEPAVLAGLAYDGSPVTNVYPYSRDGKLLLDVLLYDQEGRPLAIEAAPAEDPFRRRVVTEGGEEVAHAFPLRYVEPGTQTVENPEAAPPIDPPEIATPPLRTKRPRDR